MATKKTKIEKVVSAPMDAVVYDQKGKEAEKVSLPGEIFGVKWNADLVHQVVTALQSNARAGTADARDRSDVSGGGKKPWKQKGTGRARHGSSRSPIWKGGGVTHGPLAEKNYFKKVNKKMRTKALFCALSKKFADGQVLFVNEFNFKDIKTKDAVSVLNTLSKINGFDRLAGSKKVAGYITTFGIEKNVEKSFSNIPYVDFGDVKNLNVLDVLAHRYLVISNPTSTVEFLTKKLDSKRS